MANVTITQLPAAGPITGQELVPVVQNGQTVQTTTAAIAASPAQNQTFLTLNQEPTLPNSRALSGSAGVGLVDGGALSTLQVVLNGVSGSLESSGEGLIAKTGGTVTPRQIVAGSNGLSVTNGTGISGNPSIALTGAVAALAGLAGTGILGIVSGNSVTGLTIVGTSNQINVANGSGPGNPTISISDNPTLPGTGAALMPGGTTAQRPGGTGGQLRFNSETGFMEYYTGSTWANLSSASSIANNLAGGAANEIPVQAAPNSTTFISAPTVANTYLEWDGSSFVWSLNASGTVTSVDVDGGATGLTYSGGPITTSGTITMAGTLITSNGGTGLSSYTTGDTLYFSAGTTLSQLAIGSNGFVMTSTGSAPAWSDPANLSVGSATNLAGGTAGDLPYQTGAGATTFLTLGTATHILTAGASAPQYTDPANITVGTATNVAGGAAGSILYQSSTGTTDFLASGTGLLANNGGNPSYTITPSGLTSVTVTQNPTAALQLATKQYVDNSVSSGITIHTPVRVETPTALTASYTPGGTTPTITDIADNKTLTSTGHGLSVNDQIIFDSTSNGLTAGTTYYVFSTPSADDFTLSLDYDGTEITSLTNGTGLTLTSRANPGVGAFLTNTGANAAIQIDGVDLASTNRVLVYNQATASHNGIYTVTTVGDGSTPWVLTRATDADKYIPKSINGMSQGDYVFVQEGSTGAGESYVLTTHNPITVGTTNLTYTQFSSSQVYSAGTGLTLTDTTFSLTSPVVTSLGGTGLTTYTAGDLVYYASGTQFTQLAIGSSTFLLTSSGTAPQWSDPSNITIGTATNVAGGTANQIVYNTGANATSFITAPTSAGTYLEWSGSAFQWTTPGGGGTVSSVDTGSGLTGGPITTSGTISVATNGISDSLFRQSAGLSVVGRSANSTGNIADITAGTDNQVLRRSGTSIGFGAINLASSDAVTGTLAIANGGTNATATPTAGAIAYGTGSAYAFNSAGSASQILLSGGSSAPTWADQSTLSVGSATNATNATNTAITDDTTTNATMYPTWVTGTSGNLPQKVTSSKFTFNPSTGAAVITGGISGGTF